MPNSLNPKVRKIHLQWTYDTDDIAVRKEKEGDNWEEIIYCMEYSTDDFGGFQADIFLEDETAHIEYNATTGEYYETFGND